MASSTPSGSGPSQKYRRPQRSSTPQPVDTEDWNSEAIHKACLAKALALHTTVRENALRALEIEAKKNRIEQAERKLKEEAESVRLAEIEAIQLLKALELEAKRKAIPTPPQVTTPPQAPASKLPPQPTQSAKATPPATSQAAPTPQPTTAPAVRKPQRTPPPQLIIVPAQPVAQPAAQPPVQQTQPKESVKLGELPLAPHPSIDRYVAIHQKLKEIRKYIDDGAKADPKFKTMVGEMRRGIRSACGQLTHTGDKAANSKKTVKIFDIIALTLTPEAPSPPCDPSLFMLEQNIQPAGGAKHNDPTLPSLFIYLLNHFAKAIISQLINESGVRPETADPLGILAVTMFSQNFFLWRGKSLIDIMMSKYRMVCPVLFGLRGNEKTESGKKALGWWKEDGGFVHEEVHSMRMTGLGAGYAAICLRRVPVTRKHPWATAHYWITMSNILSTPSEQVSTTQFMVLRSMINGFEGKFLEFYGSAALGALQVALVHFPAKAMDQHVAVKSLGVLAHKLKLEMGLDLYGDAGMRA